jgi:hypothetical protein
MEWGGEGSKACLYLATTRRASPVQYVRLNYKYIHSFINKNKEYQDWKIFPNINVTRFGEAFLFCPLK